MRQNSHPSHFSLSRRFVRQIKGSIGDLQHRRPTVSAISSFETRQVEEAVGSPLFRLDTYLLVKCIHLRTLPPFPPKGGINSNMLCILSLKLRFQSTLNGATRRPTTPYHTYTFLNSESSASQAYKNIPLIKNPSAVDYLKYISAAG